MVAALPGRSRYKDARIPLELGMEPQKRLTSFVLFIFRRGAMSKSSMQHLQETIWNIETKLGDDYGVRLTYPRGKKAVLTKRGVKIGDHELWASRLFVQRAKTELSREEFERLCHGLDVESKNLRKYRVEVP